MTVHFTLDDDTVYLSNIEKIFIDRNASPEMFQVTFYSQLTDEFPLKDLLAIES